MLLNKNNVCSVKWKVSHQLLSIHVLSVPFPFLFTFQYINH